MIQTCAAVAIAPGKPLEIMDVILEGSKAAEVLVEIKATGLCHTDEFTRSGDDPEVFSRPFLVMKVPASCWKLAKA